MSDAQSERSSKSSKGNSVSKTKIIFVWKVSITKGVENTTQTCGILYYECRQRKALSILVLSKVYIFLNFIGKTSV